MAALTFKVGGDTTGLGRAVSRAKGMLSGLGGALKTGVFAGGALAIGGLAASFAGLSKALELGGRLSDVSANTGLLAGEALVLERALSDAGISGEKLQATIQKMQKSIVEAGDGLMTPKRALDELGLSVEGLLEMKPAQQFAAIQEALAGLSDPAERSARAMQIFGRSGGELGALFSNPDAMKNAAESVGVQADILTKSADEFDRSADLLAGIGDKLRSFFVGMADYINPILLPVLEEMNKVDLAKIGAGFGEAVMVVVEAFKTDRLGELAKESLLYAGKALVNTVIEGFTMAGVVLIEAMKGVGAMLKELFSLDNLKSLGKGVQASGMSLLNKGIDVGAFGPLNPLKYLGRDKRMEVEEDLWKGAESSLEHLGGLGGRLENRLAEVMQEARDRVREMGVAMDEADLMGAGESKSRMNGIIEDLRKSVQAIRKEAEEKAAAEKKVKIPPMEETKAPGMMEQVMRPVVSSLGRIGGAGIRGGVTELRMSRERNLLLKTIAANTAATSARYA